MALEIADHPAAAMVVDQHRQRSGSVAPRRPVEANGYIAVGAGCQVIGCRRYLRRRQAAGEAHVFDLLACLGRRQFLDVPALAGGNRTGHRIHNQFCLRM